MKILLTLVFALLASPAVSQMFGDNPVEPVEDTIYWRAKDAGKVDIIKCIRAAKNGVVINNSIAGRTLFSVYLTEDAVYELAVKISLTRAGGKISNDANGKSKTATCLEYKKLDTDKFTKNGEKKAPLNNQ